jgi:leader peptidase (prepilin peptidase) / N-methyltransferase
LFSVFGLAELVAAWPWDYLLSPWAAALLGLMVGSFLNVVVHRFPLMLDREWWAEVATQLGDPDGFKRVFGSNPPERLTLAAAGLEKNLADLQPLGLARPASRCPACGHKIRWYENIPLLSWLALRGRCSACGARIAWRYPLVELGTAALFAGLASRLGAQPSTLMWCAVATTLLALALIDWDTTLLPDRINGPLLWSGLVAAALGWLPLLNLTQSLLGAVVGYLSLWSVYWLFKLVTGKEGMGYGDFKLLAALGAWLGWKAILPIVLMASVIGAVVGLVMKARSSLREGLYVPFGPFLVGGGLVVMLVGVSTALGWIGWS